MHFYLPIAEISVNALTLLAIGGGVGVLSGLFGVGGGFLITPLLFFIGVPPQVAVASGITQVVASSVSGVLAHLKRKTVDLRMGSVLLVGGLFGSAVGGVLFRWLARTGQVDLAVQLAYIIVLGIIGMLMLQEGLRAWWRSTRPNPPRRKAHSHYWIHALPLKIKFRTSGLYISVVPPLLIGAGVGLLAALMGVGGGFLLIPAMIYLIGMPTKVVIGTSLFQIIFVAAFTTVMHAVTSQSVDIVLALFLIIGGALGAQLGAALGGRLRAEALRVLLALLVLGVAGKIVLDLVLPPDELFSLSRPGRR